MIDGARSYQLTCDALWDEATQTRRPKKIHCKSPTIVKVIEVANMPKIRTIQSVSLDVPASEQPNLHNRWHPDS